MCLAIPMIITKVDGLRALADAGGVTTEVNITLAPDLKLGDKVLVHAGFVIEKLDEEAARDIEAAWDEYRIVLAEDSPRP